ncbi:hypothetical protein HCN44_011486, partial [Aphidius gifuensis]
MYPSCKRAKMTNDNLSHHKVQQDACINKEKIYDGKSTLGTCNELVNDCGSPLVFSSDNEHSETTSSYWDRVSNSLIALVALIPPTVHGKKLASRDKL